MTNNNIELGLSYALMDAENKCVDLQSLRNAGKTIGLADIRSIFRDLNCNNISIHPDDDALDVSWSIDISDEDKHRVNRIVDMLNDLCAHRDLDIYEEMMTAHATVFGSRSCFYPEHRAWSEREYLRIFPAGYCAPEEDGCITDKVGIEEITTDEGYGEQEASSIAALSIGEHYDFWDGIEHLQVTRIK